MIDERDYEVARKDKALRPAFLGNVDMEEYSPFVRNVSYHPKFLNNRMTTISLPATFFSPAPKSWIIVSDKAFNLFSAKEFYHHLVHHEGFHAKDKYYDPVRISKIPSLIKDEMFHGGRKTRLDVSFREFRAYSNQIDHESFSFCSPNIQKEIIYRRDFYREKVKRLQSLLNV